MEVTDIKFYEAHNRGPVIAYANVILNDGFIIRGIALVKRKDGSKYISMPARKIKSEEKAYRDICHPLNKKVREYFTDIIFGAYSEFVEREKE